MATYRVQRTLPGAGYRNHTFTPYGGSLNQPTKQVLTGRVRSRETPANYPMDALQIDLKIQTNNNDGTYVTTSHLESGTNGSIVWYFPTSGDYPGSSADIFVHIGYGIVTGAKDSDDNFFVQCFGYDYRNGHPEGAVITNASGSFTAKLTDGTATTNTSLSNQEASGFRRLSYQGFRLPSITEDTATGTEQFFPLYMHLNSTSSQPYTHMSYPVYMCKLFWKQVIENSFIPEETPTGITDIYTSAKQLFINNAAIVRYDNQREDGAVDWKRFFAFNMKNYAGATKQYVFKMHGNGGPFSNDTTTIDLAAALENTPDGGTFMVEKDFVVTPESSIQLRYTFQSTNAFYKYIFQNTPWDSQFVDLEGLETDLDTNTTAQDMRETGVIVKPIHAGEHCSIRHKFRGVGGTEGKTINFDVINRFFALPNEADNSYTKSTSTTYANTTLTSTSDNRAYSISTNAPMVGDGFFDVRLIFRNVSSAITLEGEPIAVVSDTNCKLLDGLVSFDELDTSVTPNRAIGNPIRVMPTGDNWSIRFRVAIGGYQYTFDMSGTKKSDYGLQVWNDRGQTRLNSATRNVKVIYSASGSGTSSIGQATVPEMAAMSATNGFGYSITTHNTRVKGYLNTVNQSVDIIDQDMGNITAQAGAYFDTDDWHLIIFRR